MQQDKKNISREKLATQREKDGYKLLSSHVAYQNRWLAVRENRFKDPFGREGFYGIIERDQFAVIIPVHEDGSVTFIQQYRYPAARRMMELPMGMWEDKPDADILDLARGELAEETGLRAQEMIFAGSFFQGAGISDQQGSVFVARGLSQGKTKREPSERGMETVRIAPDKIKTLIARNEIVCMVTLSALMSAYAKNLLPFA